MSNSCKTLHVCNKLINQNLIQIRRLTAHQAAVALRPFYLIVHPDRFGRDPKTRLHNEKALQVFNGYLSDIFQNPQSLRPVQVTFSIKRANDHLENVSLLLNGVDPDRIVRMTLERCQLSAEHLPKRKLDLIFKDTTSFPSHDDSWDAESLWQKLHEQDLVKRKRSSMYSRPNDLVQCVTKNRSDALNKMENYERTKESLNDEIDDIIRRTGLKEIIWAINWNQFYMRRCLLNIKDMILQTDPEMKETITYSLFNRSLILGRGSFVCCNGALQFGADDVIGAWQKVCFEANVRNFEICNLWRLVDRVSELLGGAQLIVNEQANLLTTTEHMQTIIVRISSRPKPERKRVAQLASTAIIEIVSGYSELALLSDGRLQIPCNVDGQSLETFLRHNGQTSRTVNERMRQTRIKIMELSKLCHRTLELSSLSWESTLSVDTLIECLDRLINSSENIQKVVRGLALHLSSNSNIYVMADGRVAIPTNWI